MLQQVRLGGVQLHAPFFLPLPPFQPPSPVPGQDRRPNLQPGLRGPWGVRQDTRMRVGQCVTACVFRCCCCCVGVFTCAGLGILAKRVVQQQARLVRPVRGGGHHQEHADPAKYGKFLLPHVADGHKQVAKVRPPSFSRIFNKDATTDYPLASGVGVRRESAACSQDDRECYVARHKRTLINNMSVKSYII
jgi:hypothetical protein